MQKIKYNADQLQNQHSLYMFIYIFNLKSYYWYKKVHDHVSDTRVAFAALACTEV